MFSKIYKTLLKFLKIMQKNTLLVIFLRIFFEKTLLVKTL